jgi:hypothetical protein
MSADQVRRCELCEHFAPIAQALDAGQCSHSPPTAVVLPQGTTSMFPIVRRENFCGQFQVRGAANDQDAGQAKSRVLLDN